MEKNAPSPIVIVALKYMAFGSLLSILLIVILYYAQRHPLLMPPILDFRILIFGVFIFFSLREFRDYLNGGVLYFWQGMSIGMLCYLGMALVGSLFILIFGWIVPGFLDSYLIIATSQLEANKEQFLEAIGEKAYNAALAELPLTTVTDLAVDYFLKSIPLGLFLTIIIAVILRRQPKP